MTDYSYLSATDKSVVPPTNKESVLYHPDGIKAISPGFLMHEIYLEGVFVNSL